MNTADENLLKLLSLLNRSVLLVRERRSRTKQVLKMLGS